MPRVLLTGFGPFGSHEENPTESIVNAFPSLLPIKNPFGRGSSEMSIEKRILSVDHAGSIWTATQLDAREWDAILHLGLCGDAHGLELNFRQKTCLTCVFLTIPAAKSMVLN